MVRFDDGILPEKITSKEDILPLIEYLNSTIDNLIRITSKGIGIFDNLDSDINTYVLKAGIPSVVSLRKRPIGIIPIKTSAEITSFFWELTGNNQVSLTVKSPTGSLTVVCIVLYS
jgi:hypothetical protein